VIKLYIVVLILVQFVFIKNVFSNTCGDISDALNHCVEISVKGTNNQVLPNVVVYLEPLSNQILPNTTHTVEINQHHKAFAPYISVSQSKQVVRFTNQDDITHHIYSVTDNNKFSFKIRSGQSNSDSVFSQASEIAMGCNIHDWMSGYLLVVDTPYFDKSNKQGTATFAGVKNGQYRVVIWHPKLKSNNNRVIVEKNIQGNMQFNIDLTVELDELPAQKNDDDFDFLSDY
jgi:hypothetical protein